MESVDSQQARNLKKLSTELHEALSAETLYSRNSCFVFHGSLLEHAATVGVSGELAKLQAEVSDRITAIFKEAAEDRERDIRKLLMIGPRETQPSLEP